MFECTRYNDLLLSAPGTDSAAAIEAPAQFNGGGVKRRLRVLPHFWLLWPRCPRWLRPPALAVRLQSLRAASPRSPCANMQLATALCRDARGALVAKL
eukprot:5888143-Pleurochrysis_carterae.AAC.1